MSARAHAEQLLRATYREPCDRYAPIDRADAHGKPETNNNTYRSERTIIIILKAPLKSVRSMIEETYLQVSS